MKIFCTSLVFGLLALLALPCRADDLKDCAGCKDHPLLARYPGSILLGADQKEFEEAVLPAGVGVHNEGGDDVAPKVLDVSGRRTRLFYFAPPERSALEVFLNYKQALEKSGMSMLWTCADKECGDGFADGGVIARLQVHGEDGRLSRCLGYALGEPRELFRHGDNVTKQFSD